MTEPRPSIDEYADQLAAEWPPLTEEQLGRIAALLRTDSASRPEQDSDPLGRAS